MFRVLNKLFKYLKKIYNTQNFNLALQTDHFIVPCDLKCQPKFFRLALGYRCFQIGCIFTVCSKPTIFIQNVIFINFRIHLTQFYINFSRHEHQIELLLVSINS